MMKFRNILVTGGAGFVGSSIAIRLKESFQDIRVTSVDNLKRRGSELTLPRLRDKGVAFRHGDIRCPEDLDLLPDYDLVIDCSAEPSVTGGPHSTPRYIINTNLTGTMNCLELARRCGAAFVFLSSSRVYSIASLNGIPFTEQETRFSWCGNGTGVSEHGVSEQFPVDGVRSMYGACKLASELLVQEYGAASDLPVLINRCGILAGPWQMGRVDQGVMALWCARHIFRGSLTYNGFGGTGKQVRDFLHIDDFIDLLMCQLTRTDLWKGSPYNVGGGVKNSVSLQELTQICRRISGSNVELTGQRESNPLDLRIFITDSRRACSEFAWAPARSVDRIAEDTITWINSHADSLKSILE